MNPYPGPGQQPPQGFNPQQGYGPGQQQPPVYGAPVPAQKKGMSGCLIAFLVVLGILVVGGGIGGYFLYRFFSPFIGSFKEIAEMGAKARKAPGTNELRSMGCKDAMVFDMAELGKILQKLQDEAEKQGAKVDKKIDTGDTELYVECVNAPDDLTPEKVATKYVETAHPTREIIVTVTHGTNRNGGTSERFDKDGNLLGTATRPANAIMDAPAPKETPAN